MLKGSLMKIATLVERCSKDKYRASSPALGLQAEASTRDEAIDRFRQLLRQRIDAHVEILLLEFDEDKDILIPLTGAARRTSQDADEVVFLIPTNLTRPFFARLLQYCESRIDETFGESLRTIIRYVPRDALDGEGVIRLLRREFRLSQRIQMLVIVPTESEELSRDVAKFLGRLDEEIPVIALTLPFRYGTAFREYNLDRPAYVICNSKEGTRRLGLDASNRLTKRRESVNVALIRGAKGRVDSSARITGFLRGLEEGLKGHDISVEVVENHKPLFCGWMRDKARDEFVRLVKRTPSAIHVVFAASDEMALGVEDAIVHQLPNHQQRVKDCIIYGFDAIPEMLQQLERPGTRIKGTVEQPLLQMAAALVDLIDKARTNPALLKPKGSETLGVFVEAIPRFAVMPDPEPPPPPYVLDSKEWTTSDETPEHNRRFGNAPALRRFANEMKRNPSGKDEHGTYGIHGKRKVRKCRIVNDTVFWWIADPEWQERK